MLGDHRTHTTIPAEDLDRAIRFYADKLGLVPVRQESTRAWYETGEGTRFYLYRTSGRPSGSHTQIAFTVDDIDREVAELKRRGVEFQEYDLPNLKTVNSIATVGEDRAAWIRDSEGNVLGIAQLASPL